MKQLRIFLCCIAIFLIAITIAGAYYYDSESPGAKYPWIPARFQNRTTTRTQWGDLARFDVRVNCTMNHTASAPVIEYKSTTISEQQLRVIAADVFGMNAPEVDASDPSYLLLQQAHKDIWATGERIRYNADIYMEPAERSDWNETEVKRIADEVIDSLEPYWGLLTDAVRRVSYIRPSSWEYSDKWILAFTVRYDWSVQDIDLIGSGCSVSVSHRGWIM